MKRLSIICILLLLPIAAWAWMNVTTVGGGGVPSEGGGGTERLYPDADITTGWDSWSGPPHWSICDDTYESETEADGGVATVSGSQEAFGFANPTSMGAGNTATQLVFHFWGKAGGASTSETMAVKYSTDGGSNWSSTTNVVFTSNTYAYQTATFSSLSLSLANIQGLAVHFQRTAGTTSIVISAVSCVVTY